MASCRAHGRLWRLMASTAAADAAAADVAAAAVLSLLSAASSVPSLSVVVVPSWEAPTGDATTNAAAVAGGVIGFVVVVLGSPVDITRIFTMAMGDSKRSAAYRSEDHSRYACRRP